MAGLLLWSSELGVGVGGSVGRFPQFCAGLSAGRGAHAGLPFPPTHRFKAVSAKSKEDLVSQGFTEFTIEDFHNTVSPAAPVALSAGVEVGWPGRGGVDPSPPPSLCPLCPAGGSSWT